MPAEGCSSMDSIASCKDSISIKESGIRLAMQAALSIPGLKAEVSRAN